MRTATIISFVIALSLPLVTIARADETVIKKDEPSSSTTIIKKRHDPALFPAPHDSDTTIIKKERD